VRKIRHFILSRLVWLIYRLLFLSWRITLIEDAALVRCRQQRSPALLAHWHGDELAILHLVAHFHLATMTSTSPDGQLIDYVIRRLGGATSKGSSTRGAVQALKGLVRLGRLGHPISMAVDGPRGPIYQVKSGVFELSRLLDAPIFPVGVATTRRLLFKKSWNQTYLPKPFARVVIVFAEPLLPVSRDQDPRSDDLAKRLANAIAGAQRQAANLIAGHNP